MRTACSSLAVSASTSRVLLSMAPLTAQFSASVACRCHVVKNRWEMSRSSRALRIDSGSRTSACTCVTPGMGLATVRESPVTVHPSSRSAVAVLYPAMPVTPTMRALRRVMTLPFGRSTRKIIAFCRRSVKCELTFGAGRRNKCW